MPDGETTIQKPKGCPNSAADYSMLYRYTVAKRKIANGEAYESIVAQPGGRELWAKLESHRNWDENYHNIMLEYPQLFELGDADNAALKRMSKYASYLAAANSRDSDIPHPDDVEEDYHKYQNIRDDNREELQKQYEDAQEKFKKENAKKYGPRARMFGWGVAIAATLGLVGAIAAAAIGGLVSAVTIPSLGFGFMQGAGLAITAGIVFLVKPIASGIVKLFKKCFDKFGKANADRVAAKTERKKAKAELSTAQESYKAVQRQIAADLATERYSRMPGSRMSEQAITSFNPGAELDAEFERNYLSASERYANSRYDLRRVSQNPQAQNLDEQELNLVANARQYADELGETYGISDYFENHRNVSLENHISNIIRMNPGITKEELYADLSEEYKQSVNSGDYEIPLSGEQREYIDSVKKQITEEDIQVLKNSPNITEPIDSWLMKLCDSKISKSEAISVLKDSASFQRGNVNTPSEDGLVRGRTADSYIDDVFARVGFGVTRGSAVIKSAFSRGLDNLSQSEHFTEGEKTAILKAYDEYLDALKKTQADETEKSFDDQTFNEEDFVETPDSAKAHSDVDEDDFVKQAKINDEIFEAKQDDITYANEVAHKSLDDEIDKRVSEGQNFEQVAEWIVEETNKAKQLEADEQLKDVEKETAGGGTVPPQPPKKRTQKPLPTKEELDAQTRAVWEVVRPAIIEKIGQETWDKLIAKDPEFDEKLMSLGNDIDQLAEICKLTANNEYIFEGKKQLSSDELNAKFENVVETVGKEDIDKLKELGVFDESAVKAQLSSGASEEQIAEGFINMLKYFRKKGVNTLTVEENQPEV